MKRHAAELLVGVFVILGILAVLFLAFNVSGIGQEMHRDGYHVTAHFQNIGGLSDHAKVTMSGVQIGEVERIELDQQRYDALVHMRIDHRYKISSDAAASILTSGLLGEKYIGIVPGGDTSLLKEDSEIEQTQSALVLEDLIGKFLFNRVTTSAPSTSPPASQ